MPTPLLYYVGGALVLLLGLAVVIAVRRALGLRLRNTLAAKAYQDRLMY